MFINHNDLVNCVMLAICSGYCASCCKLSINFVISLCNYTFQIFFFLFKCVEQVVNERSIDEKTRKILGYLLRKKAMTS